MKIHDYIKTEKHICKRLIEHHTNRLENIKNKKTNHYKEVASHLDEIKKTLITMEEIDSLLRCYELKPL